jgi:biopolymer transport protein TolR
MSEINVTPFVDVMLVLLIVFMVSAPLLTVGVPIDLPESQARDLGARADPITISIDPDGKVYLQEAEVTLDNLVDNLNQIAKADDRIYVRGDRSVSYGLMMRVMGALNGAGFNRIGLVTTGDQSS